MPLPRHLLRCASIPKSKRRSRGERERVGSAARRECRLCACSRERPVMWTTVYNSARRAAGPQQQQEVRGTGLRGMSYMTAARSSSPCGPVRWVCAVPSGALSTLVYKSSIIKHWRKWYYVLHVIHCSAVANASHGCVAERRAPTHQSIHRWFLLHKATCNALPRCSARRTTATPPVCAVTVAQSRHSPRHLEPAPANTREDSSGLWELERVAE